MHMLSKLKKGPVCCVKKCYACVACYISFTTLELRIGNGPIYFDSDDFPTRMRPVADVRQSVS